MIEALVKKANSQEPSLMNSLNEPHFAFVLQKQIKKVKKELKTKEKEIAELQKNEEFVSLKELELEAQMLQREVIRLKRLLKKTKNSNAGGYSKIELRKVQENIQQQKALIVDMQKGINNSANELQEKEALYNKLKEKFDKLKKDVFELKRKHDKDAINKKTYKENLKEIKRIKDILLNKDKPNDNKIDELTKEKMELIKSLEQKAKVLEELKSEEEIKELRKKVEEYRKQLKDIERERKLLPGVTESEVSKIVWSFKLKLMEDSIPLTELTNVLSFNPLGSLSLFRT